MGTVLDLWVRSTDLDADGIVNNARYFEFFEQVRLEHLMRHGIIQRPRSVPGTRDFTIVTTWCQFLAPLRHRDVVRAAATTLGVGTRSFRLAYRLWCEGRLVAQGASVQVWLDAAGEPTVLPEPVRRALEASQQPDAAFVGFPTEGPEAARRPAPVPPPAGST